MICATAYFERRQGRLCTPGDAQLVLGVLWAHAKPEYGLQHIRAKAADGGVVLHLFFQGQDPVQTLDRTHRILHNARASPILTSYHWTDQPSTRDGATPGPPDVAR